MNQRPARPHFDARIAFVHGLWHGDIVQRGRDSFIDHIVPLGIPRELIELFPVPGAFEIPLHAKLLAGSGRFQAIVACAFVVDGGIYRHDFVAQAVIDGLMRVQLDTLVPVFSVVLTPHHFHDHAPHERFYREHFVTKGAEAARACVQTLESLRGISMAGANSQR
jgi:6,7-dimethyl-8-ribityllumazine synthase